MTEIGPISKIGPIYRRGGGRAYGMRCGAKDTTVVVVKGEMIDWTTTREP